jgi:transketolase
MDAVQKVGNGHPGTAMSLAPAAHLLFSRFLRHDPGDPQWLGRDRFVLSCGHSSLTLYIQLFLCGYGLELSDLESFRTWGSLTPGHPEHGHTVGVETTTGPLGQGISTAVGMAMASRFERGMLDPDAPWGTSPFDHHVWVIASDGDLEEGVSAEASSLAAVQRLANLTVIWDDNHISIEGNTDVAFTEDVAARYEAYGWRVHEVGLTPTGDIDVDALADALDAARYEAERPTFIAMRSVIAWPAPHAQNTAKAHGAGSNDTTINGGLSFLPAGTLAPDASPYGRILHFGIREHAMGAILNGISLSGLTRPFGGTFLVFSDYMRGAVRLSALMQTPVTYVWTHDSIGLGEDGPTHQPVEHLWSLRARAVPDG